MYSKYKLIKVLGNCFGKMKCCFWIKLILVLIYLKYRYYNFPLADLPYLLPSLSNLNFSSTFSLWFFNESVPCLYFLRYWAICVLQLFVNQVVTSWILKLTLSFQSSQFLYMTKKPWQKLKYLENEKNF